MIATKMPTKKINLGFTNEILQTVCIPVQFVIPKKNVQLAQHLFKIMQQANGIGLAANQVGINQRVFVMLANNKVYHCFNPEIVQSCPTLIEFDEGCLSFPNQLCRISRPSRILAKYFSADGKATVEWLDNLASRCFQHELDHLNGLTMHDRVIQ